jgi:peptidoglycan hydrolase-like protein with peptidoglycan-binding domain
MGRSSKARVRDVLDEHEGGVSPGAAALAVFAIGLGGMIVWNAFYGIHEQGSVSRFVTRVPKGATTYVEVPAPAKPTTSITIKYDPLVEDVQRELLATGHYRGLVDGVAGKQTSLAIKSYQQDNQLPLTGEVTRTLIDHIRFTRKVAAASEFTGSISAVEAQGAAKPVQRPVIVKRAAKPPQGLARIRDTQQKLRRLGYDIPAISGDLDAETRAAILKFELDFGLTMDGTITRELLSALKVAEAAHTASSQ